MSAAEMGLVNQWMQLFESADVFPIPNVHQTRLASTIFAETHVPVHRTPFAVLKITNQSARANKDTMDSQRFSVLTLAANQTMNAQPLTRVSIDNVYQLALLMVAPVENEPSATESITMPFVSVDLDTLVIQRSVAMLSVAEATANVQQIKHVSTASAKAHAKRWSFANVKKFAAFTITSRSAAVHQEQFQRPTELVAHTMNCAEMTVTVHRKPHASTANALTHVMQRNPAEVSFFNIISISFFFTGLKLGCTITNAKFTQFQLMLNAKFSTLCRFELWFVYALKDIKEMRLFSAI